VHKENIDQYTDKQLVKMVLEGHPSAFGVIVKSTESLVAMIVFKMIPVIEDRKDIAQDIYLKAFKQLSRFQFRSKLSTWIGKIAYNTCLHYLEKKKLVLSEDMADNFESIVAGSSPNETELFIHSKELSVILLTEMDRLPPIYKTLVHLFYREELRHEDIIQITGLPKGTVKNYLFRARKLLKDRLLQNYKNEEL
jgi:RNA polymerase sigma factor (sigma-70 family)